MTGKMETNVTKGKREKRVSRLDERYNDLGVELTNSGFRWGDELWLALQHDIDQGSHY